VAGIDVDKITIIDQTGGGGGGLPGVAAQMPAAVISITEQIEAATGINVLSALNREMSPTAIETSARSAASDEPAALGVSGSFTTEVETAAEDPKID
ncbi:hypothetical protein N9574_02715, partial [bacterium]|nr:hypothetical protein [bacterium]